MNVSLSDVEMRRALRIACYLVITSYLRLLTSLVDSLHLAWQADKIPAVTRFRGLLVLIASRFGIKCHSYNMIFEEAL